MRIDPSVYAILWDRNEAFVLVQAGPHWEVYFRAGTARRELRAFESEEEACADLYQRIRPIQVAHEESVREKAKTIVDREMLRQRLDEMGIDPTSYSFGPADVKYVLNGKDGKWEVYFSERASKCDVSVFETEEQACQGLYCLLMRRFGPKAR